MFYKVCLFLGFLFVSVVGFSEEIKIPLNPPREYDFKNQNDIFKVRKNMLEQFKISSIKYQDPKLSPLFKQIEYAKPWWGLQGIYCYGNGQKSIEGPSEESRFIDNPFLMIGVEEANAYVARPTPKVCPITFPTPQTLTYHPERKKFIVVYQLSQHEKKLGKLRLGKQFLYNFSGKNAVDLGYPYVYALKMKGIRFKEKTNLSTDIYRFKDFIHVGGSCGYKGGCNNGSPHQPEIVFSVTSLPASITFKLWNKQPKDVAQPASLIYQIILL